MTHECADCRMPSSVGLPIQGKPGELVWLCNKHFKIRTEGCIMGDPPIKPDQYLKLAEILALAYRRAAREKGHQRHGDTQRKFEDQSMFKIMDLIGDSLGPFDYQIIKKTLEATRLHKIPSDPTIGRTTEEIAEMLDVINYAAAKIIRMSQDV